MFIHRMREGLVRLIQFGLGLDGLLHLGSFGMAIYEEAFGTAIITGLQSILHGVVFRRTRPYPSQRRWTT